MDIVRCHILVCGGTGCTSTGSEELIKRLNAELSERNLDKEVRVIKRAVSTLRARARDCGTLRARSIRGLSPRTRGNSRGAYPQGQSRKGLLHRRTRRAKRYIRSVMKFYKSNSVSRFETAASSTRRTSTST